MSTEYSNQQIIGTSTSVATMIHRSIPCTKFYAHAFVCGKIVSLRLTKVQALQMVADLRSDEITVTLNRYDGGDWYMWIG